MSVGNSQSQDNGHWSSQRTLDRSWLRWERGLRVKVVDTESMVTTTAGVNMKPRGMLSYTDQDGSTWVEEVDVSDGHGASHLALCYLL